MDETQKMTKALLDFAEAYVKDNGLENKDALTALAHAYVIYGFAARGDATSEEKMRDALIGFVTLSATHMVGVISEEA